LEDKLIIEREMKGIERCVI